MPGCRRSHSEKIADSRTEVSMLESSEVCTPSGKISGLLARLRIVIAVTWKVGAL